MRSLAAHLALVLLLTLSLLAAAPSDEALRLRNAGLAELENEQPAKAEEIFQRLAERAPKDPLPWADLAIATLRQQKFEEARAAVAKALGLAPGDPHLLAIRAEIEQWGGDPPAALATFRQAAAAALDDVEIQYSLFRAASIGLGEDTEAAAGEALDRLARLRPENLLVMLQRGQRARQAGDRAAATAAYLRIRELVWQAPEAAVTLLDQVLAALEAGDLEAMRVPALRLENVLKVTPMYKEGLRELSTGIQGVPVERFRDEPAPSAFGEPVDARFSGRALSDTAGTALAAGDFDGDEKTDLAVLSGAGATTLEIRLAAKGWKAAAPLAAAGVTGLVAADLDNDGALDLVAHGPERLRAWRGDGAGGFAEATADLGLDKVRGSAAAVLDFDIEGDLDLALAGDGRPELLRNALAGPLEPVGAKSFPDISLRGATDLVASDLDRDGDVDLLVTHAGGVTWLDNLRQGRFADRTAAAGLAGLDAVAAAASADLDNDGWPDLILAGRGLRLLHNQGGTFARWDLEESLRSSAELVAVAALDADNDGRLDLAVAGEPGLAVMAQGEKGGFRFLRIEGGPAGARDIAAADLDGDGDLDLATIGAHGLHLLDNEGGNANRWLAVRLRGLEKGNSKNNLFGLGATLEVRAGSAYQFREADSEVTHFGLGRVDPADLLRVVWTNGVPQNRLRPAPNQRIVEEQVLKGSCPFLYVWDGERVRFVTDLLWGAPMGLPVAPGVWAGSDPEELVRVDGARPRDGRYDFRITEELWEAAFFDYARLWVVDHPAEVEVASSLRIVPGEKLPHRVLGTRGLRPLAAAIDARGADVTARLAARDEIYADGWERGRYQGVAREPWALTFDLGAAPAAPVRLHLDGWIFPADASLNLAVAQRPEPGGMPPRLEVETASGWRVLMPAMGFPAGKTKTMVVDTPPLPPGARRLRILSGQWLSFDRIAWSTEPADAEPRVVARLEPAVADLRYRGFSAPLRLAPNAPHAFDYARVSTRSPWLPFPGRYTRFGDVRELLAAPDDRSVILAAGDEIALEFDAAALPPVPAGWRRTLFLESHGWDKDADRNTWEPKQVEPLPFRAMSGYPYGEGESFPDTPAHREYREEWLTRQVGAPEPGSRSDIGS